MNLKDRIIEKINNNNFDLVMPYPKKNLLIEVTNACNNNCIFCYNHCMKREKKFINKNLCLKILNEAFACGIREVGFYVAGEPLLDKRLSQFIKYAKYLGYEYIYITTNGILADLNKVKDLYSNGLNSIKYSINAYNRLDYIFIHGTDNFYKVINNLSEVYKWKIDNNINLKVFVSFIMTKFTNNIDEINNIFNGKCDQVVTMNAINQGGLMPDISTYLANNLNNNEINNNIKIPCNYPFNSMIVTVEGYLTACCLDFENLLAYANLNEVSIKDAWNNQYIMSLREKHLNNNIKNTICNNCAFNCKEKPIPIRVELCNNKDDLFCNHIKERCDKYGCN